MNGKPTGYDSTSHKYDEGSPSNTAVVSMKYRTIGSLSGDVNPSDGSGAIIEIENTILGDGAPISPRYRNDSSVPLLNTAGNTINISNEEIRSGLTNYKSAPANPLLSSITSSPKASDLTSAKQGQEVNGSGFLRHITSIKDDIESSDKNSGFFDSLVGTFRLWNSRSTYFASKPKGPNTLNHTRIPEEVGDTISHTEADISDVNHKQYASNQLNKIFHQKVGNLIPHDSQLIGGYECYLSLGHLKQGVLYVTETHLCFEQNMINCLLPLKLIIDLKDIQSINKILVPGIYSATVSITVQARANIWPFSGFMQKDKVAELLLALWNRASVKETPTPLLSDEENTSIIGSGSSSPVKSVSKDFILSNVALFDLISPTLSRSRSQSIAGAYSGANDPTIDDAIHSVDDFVPISKNTTDTLPNTNLTRNNHDTDSDTDDVKANDTQVVFHLKENSQYEYDGPYYHKETNFPYVPEENGEFVLAEVELNSPPGLVFEIIFSESNPEFLIDFLESQQSTNITDIGSFDKVTSEGRYFRSYSYTKALNFPVGPKSTMCYVQEMILHLDYSNYINIITTTKTPNVPSGGSFSTKTRYMLRWGSETKSILKVSYWVDWTSSSWIKGMVESSCRTGQIAATEDLINSIRESVRANVELFKLELSGATIDDRSSSALKRVVSRRSSITSMGSRLTLNSTPRKVKRISTKDKTTKMETSNTTPTKVVLSARKIMMALLGLVFILLLVNLYYLITLKKFMSRVHPLQSNPRNHAVPDWLSLLAGKYRYSNPVVNDELASGECLKHDQMCGVKELLQESLDKYSVKDQLLAKLLAVVDNDKQ